MTAAGSTVTVGVIYIGLDPNDASFAFVGLQELSPAIEYGQDVTVSYIDPTTGDDTTAVLEDAAGNDVASFTTGSGSVPAVVNNVPANAPPEFTSAASFSAPENQTDVGTVRATDEDAGDTVSYAITGGADQARFDIDASSGILTFKDAPDHENPTDAGRNNTYMVTVTATSGTDDRALTTDQAITVTVTDVDETPAVLTVVVTSSPGTGTDTYGQGQPITVTVTFDQAVRVTGTPRIQLRVGGSDPATHLKWANYVGGSGSAALRFTYRVQAADMDSNGIFIEANELELNSGTIQGVDDDVAANLNYPRQGAQSGHKVDGSLVGTRPSAPAPPWVQALDGSTSALDVRWIEPADSVVESYDLRYRKGGSGDWEDGPQDVAETRSEITGLESGASYEVRVRATNRRGDSGWSASTTGYPATVYDIDGIYIYWTDQQGSEKLHDDVADLGSNTLENACDTGESFRAYWFQPLESRDADEWEADVQTIDGTGTAQYILRTAPELTGAVSLDGFTIIGIRIRGRFGENWSNWSRAVNLICVPTEDDSGSATGNSSTGSENATSNPLAGFELVDATAHLDAGAVDDGMTLTDIDPDKVYGFRANIVSGAELKSVKLELRGPGADDRVNRTENYQPYSLHGDSNGEEHGAALAAGSYTMTATAYSEKDGGGDQLGTFSVEFTVAGCTADGEFRGPAGGGPRRPRYAVHLQDSVQRSGLHHPRGTAGPRPESDQRRRRGRKPGGRAQRPVGGPVGPGVRRNGDGVAVTGRRLRRGGGGVHPGRQDAVPRHRARHSRPAAQHFCHRRARHQRNRPGGPDAHGRHLGHRRRERTGQRFVQLPVAGRRRGHLGSKRLNLHPDRQPAGQDHQRDGQLHRRCWPRGITHQRGDVPGCASTARKTPEPGGPSLAAGDPADLVGSRGLRRHPVRGVPGQTPGRQHERTTHDEVRHHRRDRRGHGLHRRQRGVGRGIPLPGGGGQLHRGGREVPQAGHSGDRFNSVG